MVEAEVLMMAYLEVFQSTEPSIVSCWPAPGVPDTHQHHADIIIMQSEILVGGVAQR